MSTEVPNSATEGPAAAPHLRPAMRSAEELPEPWVRLAMARSRVANQPLPHSELGMIAFGLAVLVAAGIFYEVARAVYLTQVPLPVAWHGVEHPESMKEVGRIWRQAMVPVLLPAQAVAFLLGAISLKARGNKRFGRLAMLVSASIAVVAMISLIFGFGLAVLDPNIF